MSDQLEAWVDVVNRWGGRTDSDQSVNLKNALRNANLGSQRSLPTSQAAPNFSEPITLAQMDLPVAIPVDVSFDYPNMMPSSTAPSSGLDQGSGFVQVTWGTPGAFKHTAKIDGNRGWRYPFTASWLRIEYIPLDPLAATGWEIPGGQFADLLVEGMISPASGAACQPLTRTMYFEKSIVGVGFDFRVIPDWAVNFKISNLSNIAGAIGSVVLLDSTLTVALLSFRANATPGEYPNYALLASKHVIPQPAKVMVFAADALGSSYFNTTAVCELAL